MGPCLSKSENKGTAYEFAVSDPKAKAPDARAPPESSGNGTDAKNATKAKRAPAQRVMSVSKDGDHEQVSQLRQQGMTERLQARPAQGSAAKPETPAGRKANEDEVAFIKSALENTVVFHQLDETVRDAVAREMTSLEVHAGERMIQEGDMGSEMYLVHSGTFDIFCHRRGTEVKVNSKAAGDIFGEISLMFESPRSASVVATSDAVVWMLDRKSFRELTRKVAEEAKSQHLVFLNSVPILASLTVEERIRVAEALEEKTFLPGEIVVEQGSTETDYFYIVAKGEAVVRVAKTGDAEDGDLDGSVRGMRTVNHLFRADFFGEKALLYHQPRDATVMVPLRGTPLVCLCLGRSVFTDLLGPLQEIMAREKSAEVVEQRMRELEWAAPWMRADVKIVDRKGRSVASTGTCSNVTFASLAPTEYLEQQQLLSGGRGTEGKEPVQDALEPPTVEIELREGDLLGGGASGSVRRVECAVGGGEMKTFALKKMRKCAVMSTPEHIYCEQSITKELKHFACMRQHASFQDDEHLYFLFDFVDGCDLMDALAAVATVQNVRLPKKPFTPKIKMLKGMPEEMAMYYIAVITSAFEYLHDHQIVYRDLKPENVLLASDGTAKLGDFGFAKKLEKGQHTYTFCGTPGYVAPEVVLARGYGTSVDWWGLGVMMYVLLTGQQPFSQIVGGKPEDPLTVMKRIVDRSWHVSFPVYLSEESVDIMSWFMERRSAKRLGNLRRKASDIRTHAWFAQAEFDWEALRTGQLKPKPLALSEAFAEQHRNRILDLEREIFASMVPENPVDLEEACKIFEDF